jgi:cytochrome c peroxidase
MTKQLVERTVLSTAVACLALTLTSSGSVQDTIEFSSPSQLDQELLAVLQNEGFTGRIESRLEQRLGRQINHQLADLGRLLWFDTVTGLNDDNACAGCHSPTSGFGDTQSIAIGIESNGVVGPHRAGPRNMRRTPMAINTAFFPKLMWNSRFASLSGDPLDNRRGFPAPE